MIERVTKISATCPNCGDLKIDEVEYNQLESATVVYWLEDDDGVAVARQRTIYPSDTDYSYFDCLKCGSGNVSVECEDMVFE